MPTQLSRLDTSIEIVTPENIAFRYRVAGPFRRFPAYLIDVLLRAGLFLTLGFVLSLFSALGGGPLAVVLLFLGWFAIEWFYGALFETYMNGQTPGKWILGVRVLTVEGQPINGLQAVMRNLFRLADTYPILSLQMFGVPVPAYVVPTYLVGLVTMTCNRRFQRLGDLVAGTMVVIEDRSWLMGIAKLDDPRAVQLAEYIPADFRVSRSLAQALATYVERRRFFTQLRRREVAKHLAEPLLEKFRMRPDTGYDLLLCALYYRTFVADRAQSEDPVSMGAGGTSPARASAASSLAPPTLPSAAEAPGVAEAPGG
jgi:uncharacterized RDD family membrane protein YckC